VSGFLLTILSAFIIRRPSRIRQLGLDLLFSAGIILLVYLVFELFVGIELPSSIFLD
jgi:lipopolysaccharide export LptBFGC system permease protein LptF